MSEKWSAESITKFLRSKDTSIDQVIKVSNDLLEGELNVYLPNKLTFVFELFCDRFNDNKSTKFRESPEIWSLFYRTWGLLQSEPKVRNRIFQSLKFGEVLAYTLGKAPRSTSFLLEITAILNTVRLESILGSNTFDHSIEILNKYLETVIELSSELEETEITNCVESISVFFETLIQSENITKKFIAKFASTALPTFLRLMSIRNTEYPILISIIKKVLLSKEQQPDLATNVTILLKAKPQDKDLVLYYSILIDSISRNDVETAEKLFTLITNAHPDTTERLLVKLSKMNRTLSFAFLDGIVTQELSRASQNWNLILSILELDIEIGIKYASDILKNPSVQETEIFVPLGKQLLHCFTSARELLDFFEKWCLVIVKPGSKWASPEICDVISDEIYLLSSSQLQSLTDKIFAKEVDLSEIILLNTIVQGLFKTESVTLVQESKTMFSPVFEFNKDQDELWGLKYQLLCLYEDLLDDEALEKTVKDAKKITKLQHFYLLFRIREIHEYNIESVGNSFIKHLKSNHSSSVFETIFQRWFVMINTFFDSTQIDLLAKLLLDDKESLLSIFENDLLFEQPRITESLINTASASLKESVDSFKLEALKYIPIQCYPRKIKPALLDQLSDMLFKKSQNTELILDVIEHILQTPTFRSRIESDTKLMHKVLENFPKSTVFTTVWSHHIMQSKESASQKYISSMLFETSAALEKGNINKLSSAFYIAFGILSNSESLEDSKLAQLKDSIIIASKSLLNSFITKKSEDKLFEITWLLNVLYQLDLSSDDFHSLKSSIQQFGKNLGDNKVEAKVNIFLLFSKYSDAESLNIQYFEALYVVLRDLGAESKPLIQGLGNVVSQLNEGQFQDSLAQVLYSLEQENASLLSISEILTVYWKYFQKESPSSPTLFIASISKILMHFHKFANTEALKLIISSLKTVLVEKTWIVTQYGLELIITLLSKASNTLLLENNEHSVHIYNSITLTLSNILLFQRFRLSNRHHIIIALFKSLLAALAKQERNTILSGSVKSAEGFSRVLSNLCEPPNSFKDAKETSLNSSTSVVKRSLRKHLPVLLLSYIHFSLKYSFDSKVRVALLPGIFNIFDVLSQSELVLVSASLDNSGRTYYRSLYDDYKKVGKWKND